MKCCIVPVLAINTHKNSNFPKAGHNEDHILYFHLARIYANQGEEALLDIDHCLWDQCNKIRAEC